MKGGEKDVPQTALNQGGLVSLRNKTCAGRGKSGRNRRREGWNDSRGLAKRKVTVTSRNRRRGAKKEEREKKEIKHPE